MSTLRVIVSGIDTLHLFSRAPVRTRWLERLEAAKEAATTTQRGAPLPSLEIAGRTLTMQRTGARTAPFRLESADHMAVLVSPNTPENLPSVTVELRSLYLWQKGPAEAAEAAQAVADELTVSTLQHELQVTRVDLTADFQGWIPEPADRHRIVSRATRRTTHEVAQRFTGLSIGHNDVLARLYDKTVEIRKSEKAWFFDVWRRASALGVIRFRRQIDYAACLSRAALSNSAGLT